MKTHFLLKDVTDINTFNDGVRLVRDKFATIGIDFTFETSVFTGELRGSANNYVDTAGVQRTTVVVDPKLIPRKNADNTCLIYDWSKVTPQPTNPGNTGKLIQIPVQFYVTYPEVFAHFFLHEICHDLTPDLTHNQYTNPEWSQKPPIEYYLYLLKTYYKPVAKQGADVVITRYPSTVHETTGELVAKVDGTTFTCKTLELPWLNNANNISCIPKGLHTVRWTFSPKFLRYTYEVQNVHNRSGIRVHAGNFYKDYKGCIGLGKTFADLNKDGETDITSTKATVKAFEALMNKRTFTLEIK